MKNISIDNIVRNNLCIQCGTCESICPENILLIKEYKRSGLMYPHFENGNCIKCGLCKKVCPVEDFSLHTKPLVNYQNIGVYSTFSGDDRELISSSGGAVSLIIRYLFDHDYINKAVVSIMEKNLVLEPKAVIIDKAIDLAKSRGSVYQPIPVNRVIKYLNSNDRVAYVGLPCHMKGLVKYISVNKELNDMKIYKIGIFCNIGRSKNATRFLIDKYVKEANPLIEYIYYRAGNYPGQLVIKLSDKKYTVLFKEYITRIGYLFTPKGCLFCDDLFNEEADISIGDPWGVVDEKKAILIARNDKGASLIKEILDCGLICNDFQLSEEETIATQNYKHKEKRILRSKVYNTLNIAIPNRISNELSAYDNQRVGFFDIALGIILFVNSRLFNSRFYVIAKIIPFKLLEKLAGSVKRKYK